MRPQIPKKGSMKHAESSDDLEAGPLLDKDEQLKHLAPQDIPGRILGLPIQLVAGICYCCGTVSRQGRIQLPPLTDALGIYLRIRLMKYM